MLPYPLSLFSLIFPWDLEFYMTKNHLNYPDGGLGLCVCLCVCVKCVYVTEYIFI